MGVKVIAEIGINHNGDIELCKQLIKLAVDTGCDAVKFQKRDVDKVYSPEFLSSARESPWGNTQRDQKVGLEFDGDDYAAIDQYCKNLGIHWFASAWDLNSQKFLQRFDLPYNKVASAMLVDFPLMQEIATEGRHTFISTGMADMPMIEKVVDIFVRKGCPFELMHCVSTYPMDPADANLKVIETLRRTFECPVGYSGHEAGLAVSCAAVALGASSLERHITLDRTMYGSDQAASLEPAGLRQLVGAVRIIEQALSKDGAKEFTAIERPVAEKLRAHIRV